MPDTAVAIAPAFPPIVPGPSLKQAFDEWKPDKGIVGKDKTADEFETAIGRLEILCRTSDVTFITTEMVENFRDLVAKRPARPKKAIRDLPLIEHIAQAEAQALPTLLPLSVGKQASAVRSALAGQKTADGSLRTRRWALPSTERNGRVMSVTLFPTRMCAGSIPHNK